MTPPRDKKRKMKLEKLKDEPEFIGSGWGNIHEENESVKVTHAMSTRQRKTPKPAPRNDEVMGEDKVTRLTKPTDPLSITLVVGEVIKYLGVPELKNCRLVNRLWNTLSTSQLKTVHPPVTFTKSTEVFRFNQVMLKAEELPFTSFRLRTRLSPRIEKYFASFASSITALEITSKPGKKWNDFDGVFKLLEQMPKLQNLKLNNVDFPKVVPVTPPISFASTSAPSPLTMEHVESLTFNGWFLTNLTPVMGPLDMAAQQRILDLYNACPNTKHLELNILRATIVQNFLVGITIFKGLETLSVQSLAETDLVHVLRVAGSVKLRSVTLKEVHLNTNGENLLKFMEAFSETLEHLDMRVLTTRGIRLFKFPVMKALKRLHLDTFFATDIFQLSQIDITDQDHSPFPALKTLVLSQNVLHGLQLANFTSSSVTEIILKMSPIPMNGFRNAIQDEEEPEENPFYDSRQSNLIRHLPTMFPAMKKMRAEDVRCSALKVLFQTLADLEELEIFHSPQRYGIIMAVYLNQVLSGIEHPEWFSRMHAKFLATSSAQEKEGIQRFLEVIAPDSIRNMRNLKVLKLSGQQCLDEAAVRLGLLQLQPLDRLVLQESAVSFSGGTLSALRAHHKLVQIIPVVPPPTPGKDFF